MISYCPERGAGVPEGRFGFVTMMEPIGTSVVWARRRVPGWPARLVSVLKSIYRPENW